MMVVFLETGVQIILGMVRALGILSLPIKWGKFALFWKALYPGGWAKVSWASLSLMGFVYKGNLPASADSKSCFPLKSENGGLELI